MPKKGTSRKKVDLSTRAARRALAVGVKYAVRLAKGRALMYRRTRRGVPGAWTVKFRDPDARTASGYVFALLGAYLPLRRAIGVNVTQLLIVLGINVVIGFVVPGIAWEGHLGGLVAGAAIGLVYARTRRPEQRTTQVVSVAGVAVAILAIIGLFVASAPGFYGL